AVASYPRIQRSVKMRAEVELCFNALRDNYLGLQILRVVHLVARVTDPARGVDIHYVREIDDLHGDITSKAPVPGLSRPSVLSPAAPADVADRPIDAKACRARSDRWRWSQAAGPDAVADKGAQERRPTPAGGLPSTAGQRAAARPPTPPGPGEGEALPRLPKFSPPVPRLPRNRVMGSPVRRLGARADNLPASQPACGGCPAALTD